MSVARVKDLCLPFPRPVPQVRESQVCRQGGQGLDESVTDCFGRMVVGEVDHHHVTGCAFDQSRYRGLVVGPVMRLLLPMAGRGAVLDLCRVLGNHKHGVQEPGGCVAYRHHVCSRSPGGRVNAPSADFRIRLRRSADGSGRRGSFPPTHAALAQPEVLIAPDEVPSPISLTSQPGLAHQSGAWVRVQAEFSCCLPRALNTVKEQEEVSLLGRRAFPLTSPPITWGPAEVAAIYAPTDSTSSD